MEPCAGCERIFLGLGSNSPDARSLLESGCRALGFLPEVRMVACSRFYRTEPQDFRDQPWFTNCVAELRAGSVWTPERLLRAALAIESRHGRVRDGGAPRFGPRTLDIDLLLFGGRTSSAPDCILPHPRMLRRAFVLVPLQELAPDLVLAGEPLSRHLARLLYRLEGTAIHQTQPAQGASMTEAVTLEENEPIGY